MANLRGTMRRMNAGYIDDYLKKENELDYKDLVDYVRLLGFTDSPEIYHQKIVRKFLYDNLTAAEIQDLKAGRSVRKEATLPSGRVISGTISSL